MDGFNEKKWFVYLTDHHEGPFSLADIQAKMSQSQVSTANFVWAEGMTDWKPMNQVPEFESVLSGGQASAAPMATPMAMAASDAVAMPMSAEPMTPSAEPVASAQPVQSDEKTGDLDAADLKRAKEQRGPEQRSHSLLQANPAADGNPAAQKPAGSRVPTRLIKWAFIILIPAGIAGAYFNGSLDPVLHSPGVKAGMQAASDFAQPYLLKLADKVPALAKWVSPIPSLEDVSPEEYEILKAAAMAKPEEGPKLALAASSADVLSPAFYVSSNLPDGAVIDVYVEGIPDTLLNQLSFSAKAQATIQKKLGKTGAVRYPDGKPLPRGEYVVYATESAQQPDAVKAALANVPPVTAKTAAVLPKGLKLLASKPVFLGGNKDATYDSRLKEFHDKLRAKASAEIAEIKQLQALLDDQLNKTLGKYNQLHGQVRGGKSTPAARKGWNDFDKQWRQIDEQLRQSYAKWTEQALATEYFYGNLYAATKSTGETVAKVHQLHADFFDGKTDARALEIQHGSAVSVAQAAVMDLKHRVDQAEALTPTPNGMPRREGL